jgi:hypothetical protein
MTLIAPPLWLGPSPVFPAYRSILLRSLCVSCDVALTVPSEAESAAFALSQVPSAAGALDRIPLLQKTYCSTRPKALSSVIMRLSLVQIQPGRHSEHAFSSTIFARLMDYRYPSLAAVARFMNQLRCLINTTGERIL